MEFTTALPIDDALPGLTQALRTRDTAVLVAPPGAGKTTRVPLVLMAEPWAAGQRILVLEPRRLAARAAAARMAATLGEDVGGTVGYRVRFGSKVSGRTRIEVVTEGVFTRMLLDDPALEGVAAILFDEFHERSLDADLGLALARDVQQGLREDLKLLVMSATIDGARIAEKLGGAPVIESAGRAFAVETRYLGRDANRPLTPQVADAVKRALAAERGSILVFLPGTADIRRTERLLGDDLRDDTVDIVPLYGALDAQTQDRAIAPALPGRRKVVLATAIAETSLTIEGVRVVVDSGLARVPRYEPNFGLTRLETVRVSQAAADQRRGRAGRTEPGVCYRLWDERETRALQAFAPPEIFSADLSSLVLDLAHWGVTDPGGLLFLDAPPPAAWAEAKALLQSLGALDADGRITDRGHRLRALPLPPRLARMVLDGASLGAAPLAADLAVVLTERGLGGNDLDLAHRVEGFRRERSRRADEARAMAKRWAEIARASAAALTRQQATTTPREAAHSGGGSLSSAMPHAERAPSPLVGEGRGGGYRASASANHPPSRTAMQSDLPFKGGGVGGVEIRQNATNQRPLDISVGMLLAIAFPDRVAKNRAVEGAGASFLLASGRGASIDETSPLARELFLAIAELSGGAANARVLLAAPLTLADIEILFDHHIAEGDDITFDAASASLRGRRVRRLDALVLAEQPLKIAPGPATAAVLARGAAALGLARLPWSKPLAQWRDRVNFLRRHEGQEWPDLSDAALTENAEEWLAPALADKTALSQLDAEALSTALHALLPWNLRRRLDLDAPTHFAAPSGSHVPIDYASEDGPKLAIRVQELFGLDRHPSVAGGRIPLVIELLSPAHRPVQVTRDLPSFWRGSYAAVRTEMRGRYPKHPWPEDPLTAPATHRAKPRGA